MTANFSGTDIVLIGGGHAHVEVLSSFARHPMDGMRLTLVTQGLEMIYSGMLPGRVAGHYSHEDCVIDLDRLCRAASGRLVPHAAIGLDVVDKKVLVQNGPPVGYDVVSIDVGIVPKLETIAGADRYAIAVKPITGFEQQWLELKARCHAPDGPRHIMVIGGGPAGFELILAMQWALTGEAARRRTGRQDFTFTLVSSSPLLGDMGRAARAAAERVLRARGVLFIADRLVASVEDGGAHLADGRFVRADAIIVATEAKAPPFLTQTGVHLDAGGFVAVRGTLQCLGNDDVFAVGDCAGMIEHPRPKAGVFAVRQGPVLAENLRRRVLRQKLDVYLPQKRALMLIGLGNDEAMACWGRFAITGRWAWRWKQRIDRSWIGRYQKADFHSRGH